MKMRQPIAILTVCVAGLLSASCATATPHHYVRAPHASERDVADIVYSAAEALANSMNHLNKETEIPDLARNKPIIVTTVVSVNDLTASSGFGRIASQLVMSKLSKHGWDVRDVTYTRGILAINPRTGEVVLSRDGSRLSREYGAQAVVTGTYAVAGKEIILSLRMLSADTGSLLSSADAVIPLDANTAALVGAAPETAQAGSLDVRHMSSRELNTVFYGERD